MKSLLLSTLVASAAAHVMLTYPGSRGDNLSDDDEFPYGMQFTYPCGGLNVTENRTYWPIEGGTVSFEPGWRRGHEVAQLYVNLGIGDEGPDGGPRNMSFPMVHEFQINGPTNEEYEGMVCLPQVSLPEGVEVEVGDLATIQVVEIAQHGAALYDCVDIEFVESDDPRLPEVNDDNCQNSTDISFSRVTSEAETDGDDEDNYASRSRAISWTSMSGMALLTWWML